MCLSTKKLLLFVLLAPMAACGGRDSGGGVGDPPPRIQPIATEIRVENATSHEFLSLVVNGVLYGALDPGESSDYAVQLDAYSYAAVDVNSGAGIFQIQPIDFVGETRLPQGRYTYRLQFDNEAQPTQLVMSTQRNF